MSAEELEDAGIEGYTNVFDEKARINITTALHDLNPNNIMFEEAFGTISFSAILRLDFSNPLNSNFLSAQAIFAIRGSLTPSMKDSDDFVFAINAEQVKVQEFTPYFHTEISLADFDTAFKKSMVPYLLKQFNKRLS